ncbi:kinase-like domain-containing protein [Lobosporangium transversale]|uniref:Kinase-like domain-containing protein n=1 Tax=Lobosporangium transversale TaxID=64571 RepID=A0A1Y2GCE0_9FUNG|nr:kinase-like domain-containing protein [Lobosporangium transversale]ORZ06992.1 kinase-like domain-containing protein [Lobosporangium transversale]|eukprot:XP_021877788.1 kinase-like domain-containing protein [Lobosporangium transversale]
MEDLIQIGWTKSRPLLVETCMRQILEGLAWVHDEAGLIHRDISASNIMVAIHPTDNNINKYEGEQALQGSEVGIIQCLISDFGCATFQNPKETMGKDREEPFDNQQECRRHQEKENIEYDQQRLTFEVGTRAYRAPELLFSSENYTNTIDIWSAGVLFAGMFLGRRLFEAESDIGQVCAIVKVLGTPTEENWPEYPTMPDYGKLMFQALETNPLSSILLPTGPTSEAPQHKDSSSSHNYLDKEGVSVAKCSSSPATISDTAFKLIESMITYSGSARPSARRALAFKDHYLERTKQLEPGHERQSAHGDQMEQTKMRKDFLEQCIIHEQTILEEMQRLRARQAEEEEEEGGYDGFMFGGPRRPPERPSDDEAGSEGEGEEEGGGDGYRSDDLSGEAVAGLRQQGEIRHLMPGFEVEGAYGFEEYSGDSAALTTAGSPRSIKRHRASSGEE